MLGTDAVDLLTALGHEVTAVDLPELDVLDDAAVGEAVGGHDVVWNCAAWTAVDAAEEQEGRAFDVNAVGPAHLARHARAAGARLVHMSTDYVFDGTATSPYDEDAPMAPRSAYGRTKAAGEWAVRSAHPDGHLVVRTAWLYGAHGGCFPKTMARLAHERDALSVVDDQTGQPTWTRDVADLVVRLVDADAPVGTYHATSQGAVTWFGFTREVVASAGLDPAMVSPTTTDAFPRPAPRPAYSVLGHRRLKEAGVDPIGPWEERWKEAASAVLAAVE